MAILNIPVQNKVISNVPEIKEYLNQRGIWFDQWQASIPLAVEADQTAVLQAYSHVLEPYMQSNGYKVADVINLNAHTPDYPTIRNKFLKEHTHTEDEVRFFVDGKGHFWFNLGGNEPVFNLLCEAGDLISVPAQTRHWFDAGASNPFVKAIRIFIDTSGWVPYYTEINVAEKYIQ